MFEDFVGNDDEVVDLKVYEKEAAQPLNKEFIDNLQAYWIQQVQLQINIRQFLKSTTPFLFVNFCRKLKTHFLEIFKQACWVYQVPHHV